MKKLQRVYFFEIFLYVAVLVIALSIPFLTGMFARDGWISVLRDWSLLSLFVIVFLINNYLLVPRLLFREKYLYYFSVCILLVILVAWLSTYLFELTHPWRPPFEAMHGDSPFHEEKFFPGKAKPHMPPPHRFFNFGIAIVSFLLIGFNTGVKSFVRWNEEHVRRAEKDRQHFLTELSFLKHQISPHFFMNTMNNIHSLIDINSEEAKKAIIRLSRMMRYLLYESDIQTVALSKEMEFVKSYIELMRLRYDENSLAIEVEYPENIDNIAVPPFLFLPFIENAFKHGVNPCKRSYINIRFHADCEWLSFDIRNSKSDYHSTISEASGIGLENTRKRLHLLYQDKYFLKIDSLDDSYEVTLKIPVNNC